MAGTKRRCLRRGEYEYAWGKWEKNRRICPICKKRARFVAGRGFVVDGYIPFEIDHIIPISKGGTYNKKNLHVICRACNRKKGNEF